MSTVVVQLIFASGMYLPNGHYWTTQQYETEAGGTFGLSWWDGILINVWKFGE